MLRSPTRRTFKSFLAPLRRIKWVVYCKEPFAGPSRCCAICRATPIALPSPIAGWSLPTTAASRSAGRTIASKVLAAGKRMTLAPHEFIRRFLIHVLPKGFHRIRHYGLFANGNRAESIAKARELLAVAPRMTEPEAASTQQSDQPRVCPAPMPLLRWPHDRHRGLCTRLGAETRPTPATDAIRIDTS